MIESDPVLISFLQYESLKEVMADEAEIDKAWGLFVRECERVMVNKIKND